MVGKIFITRSGYDPQRGRHIKDPYLGDAPSLGACRPDIRRLLGIGDYVFAISGRVPDANQFVMIGFEIGEKIDATEAYRRFPDQRLRQLDDGQLAGNVIVDAAGNQHPLDNHNAFDRRIKNYVVGRNSIALRTPEEIALGRDETLEALREILKRNGKAPLDVVTRFGRNLTDQQVLQLRAWLASIKRRA